MISLPIHQVIPKIISTLSQNSRLVLQAPPGAGKTTAVPIALLNEPWLKEKQIIMLEPRRLAARNAAAHMSKLLGKKVGDTVGYQIRAERCISNKTKIIVVTEGILTRMLQSDPALEKIALVIFDEFHERNLHGDLALALTLQSQELLRDDLKILVMSATLNTDAISNLLDGAPIITSDGRSFPVQNIYLKNSTPHPSPMQLSTMVAKIVTHVIKNESGSILIFLPGIREIKNVELKLIELFKGDDTTIIAPLYGDMNRHAQDTAIAPCKENRRKIVLATNIAETSLTIEGITTVIDSGLQKISTFNSGSGMNRLHTVAISKDSAIQRSGRAGRLSSGTCYRLWHEHHQLARHSLPEILTSDLAPTMLELANWGINEVNELQWLDLPAPSAVEHARKLLRDLGAIKGTKITEHGKAMLTLGAHPRLAHMMIVGAKMGHGYSACLIAALLSEKDIFTGNTRRSTNLFERVIALQEHQSNSHINTGASQRVLSTALGFRKKLSGANSVQTVANETVSLLLAFAYPDRIAKCRNRNSNRYILSGGKGAVLNIEDELFNAPYLVIANLDASHTDARIFSAVSITETAIETHLGELITKNRVTKWSNESERVEAREVTKFGAITLNEHSIQNISSSDISTALLGAIREKGLHVFQCSKESLALQQRVNFLNCCKEIDLNTAKLVGDLPRFDDKWLLDHLEEWILPHLEGIKDFKTCGKLNTFPIFLSMLSWEQQQRINDLAPAKLKVPSGSNIFLNYENPASPTLSVRLQELFGMQETPQLLNGTVNITVELLSPANRPMQVTKDLRSFWKNTYHEVKKELRGKYKKHYWPDDPFTAKGTSKTKKNVIKVKKK